MPVRLEPVAPRSRVKHSTTELPHYLIMIALSDHDASDLHCKILYLRVCHKISQILIPFLTSNRCVAVMSVSDHEVSVPS